MMTCQMMARAMTTSVFAAHSSPQRSEAAALKASWRRIILTLAPQAGLELHAMTIPILVADVF
jgi:hypothetical protein